MAEVKFSLNHSKALVVGSFSDLDALVSATPADLLKQCDIAEIRLDLLVSAQRALDRDTWSHLSTFPLLFTARRKSEGSPIDLGAMQRSDLLAQVLDDASLLDIEFSSYDDLAGIRHAATEAKVPFLSSFHNFKSLPDITLLEQIATDSIHRGASLFKIAAYLSNLGELGNLLQFQSMSGDRPIATMGMGPLGFASRLLCAQAGSVLNYGFIGSKPTAPGQWPAQLLKQAIDNSAKIVPNNLF